MYHVILLLYNLSKSFYIWLSSSKDSVRQCWLFAVTIAGSGADIVENGAEAVPAVRHCVRRPADAHRDADGALVCKVSVVQTKIICIWDSSLYFMYQHIEAWTKWLPFFRWHFEIVSTVKKLWFSLKFHWSLLQSIWVTISQHWFW